MQSKVASELVHSLLLGANFTAIVAEQNTFRQ